MVTLIKRSNLSLADIHKVPNEQYLVEVAYFHLPFAVERPNPKNDLKIILRSFVNTIPGTAFTKLPFLRNLRIRPVS
jgi:hypothetical protein